MSARILRPVRELAHAQSGVVSRRQLLAAGMTRWQILAQLNAGRWKAHGRQTIAVHAGDLDADAMRWFAVFEAGPRSAIDGDSALVAAGLSGWTADLIRVSVPRGAPAVRRKGLMVRQTRRLHRDDIVGAGVPRVRPPVAAVRAALWARSDRQAATILAMTVQQRIATAESIGVALLAVKRHKRLKMLRAVILDLIGGSESLGELDFLRLCRRNDLPAPDRQVIRKGSSGSYYLDVYWLAFRLVVEIDGIHHLSAGAIVADAIRHNDITLDADAVLRIPLLGMRVAEAEFMRQIQQGLTAAGWRSSLAS